MQKQTLSRDPFPSNQTVLIIDSDQTELTLINENLIPPTRKINSITELGNEVSNRIKEKNDFITLIIGSTIPPKIKEKFDSLVVSLNSLNQSENFPNSIPIIRIGKSEDEKEEVFKNTIAQYNTVTEFTDDIDSLSAKGITKDLNINDDIKRKINRLETSTNRYKARAKDNAEKAEDLQKRLDKAKEKLKTVDTQTEIAQQKLDKARALEEKLEKDKKEKEEVIETLQRQNEKDIQEIKNLKLDNASKDTKIDALQIQITDLNAEINTLNQRKRDLENKVQELTDENEDLAEQQSEFQKITKLRKNNNTLNEKIDELKEKQNDIKTENIRLKLDKEQLEKRLEKFREGDKDIIKNGFSKHLPAIPLKRTNVIYFKVLQEPNYFRTVLNFLYDKIFVQNFGEKTISQMVVLRQDNGDLDDTIFPEMQVISDLGELIDPNQKSRLIATPKMSRHTDVFENNNDFLFFIDYINSKDIFVETEAQMEKIVVTHTFDEFKRSGLSGMPITIDKNHSLFDLSYQKDFKNLTKQLYEQEMIQKLDNFLKLPLIEETISANLTK